MLHATRVFAALLLACTLAGCSSGQKASGKSDYMVLYSTGQYARAYDEASRVAGGLRSGSQKNEAALIAGLSAQALNRNNDADRWLRPLLTIGDDAVAGQAAAALGLIAAEQNLHRQAADLLTDAATKLKGDNAARSAMYAGDSYRALKQEADAQKSYSRAMGLVQTDSQLRTMIAARQQGPAPQPMSSPGVQTWSVQVGAFTNRFNAQREVDKLRTRGEARIVEIKDKNGRPLYAVRLGRYPSKSQAEAVRRSLGGASWVTDTRGE